MNCQACHAEIGDDWAYWEEGLPVCYWCYNFHHKHVDENEVLKEDKDGFKKRGDI